MSNLLMTSECEEQAADLDGDLCWSNALGSGVQVAVQGMRRYNDGAAGRHVHPVLQLCFVHVLQGPLQELPGMASVRAKHSTAGWSSACPWTQQKLDSPTSRQSNLSVT